MSLQGLPEELAKDLQRMELQVICARFAAISIKLTLLDHISQEQRNDKKFQGVFREPELEKNKEFAVTSEGTLQFQGRTCVPSNEEIRKELLDEAHRTPYSIHPGATKMYQDLKKKFWWSGMKRDVLKYVEQCLTCQRVKAEHQRPAGLLQPLPIPEWKWDQVTMDFVSGLPKTPGGYDSVWVVVDRLTKSAHFIPVKTTYSIDKLAEMYIKEIVRLHGVPISIVSDRDSRFTSRFWRSLQKGLGTSLKFSTAYHPQTDGQSERTIQILEDMLRACSLDFQGTWGKYLPLAEFAYNNSYQATIGMAPYEALYGRKCRSPIHWLEAGERLYLGPELVDQASEAIKKVRARMLSAQSRQKSYADRRRRPLEFQEGDLVFLKVSPMRGVVRFETRSKLNPRFVGPFEVLERIGKVAYRLALPPRLAGVHDVFHVSMLRKYVADPSHVLEQQEIEVSPQIEYQERPIGILDRQEKVLRNKTVPIVKVQWQNRKGSEATWELESEMRANFPDLF